jgi:hypothetical protein
MLPLEAMSPETKMTAPSSAIFVLWVLAGMAGVAMADPRPGGPAPGAAPGGGARPGGPSHGVRPPVAAEPRHGAHPGGAHDRWYGPSVRFYYGGPYWGGWGWPGYVWPGYYTYGTFYAPSYYGHGYVPPYYVYGPQGVVTSTGGVVYIERQADTVSTQQPEPAPAPAPAPPPAREAAAAAPPPAGTQWWYLCSSPRGAYPYVRECPGGWERVPAVPPDLSK